MTSPGPTATCTAPTGTALLLVLAISGSLWSDGARAGDPFAFFRPWLDVTAEDEARLDRDEVVVRVLPAGRGEVAVVAITAVQVLADTFVERIRDIEELKRSRFVHAIRRFSDPPRLDDLAALTLDQRDLDAIRRCRPGDCGMKLPAADIEALQAALERAGPDWADAVHDALRRAVLRRVELYRAQGLDALPEYRDREDPVRPYDVFAAILKNSPYLMRGAPALATYLLEFPHAAPADVESFLYWSKEQFDGKPIVSVTHVCIWRGQDGAGTPMVLVAGRQVLATHYTSGALALTALLGGVDESSTYLVYLNRSRTDVLGGFWGGIKRAILEGRLKRETGQVVQGLRTRFETGTQE